MARAAISFLPTQLRAQLWPVSANTCVAPRPLRLADAHSLYTDTGLQSHKMTQEALGRWFWVLSLHAWAAVSILNREL
jgi:hypothetical protein